jgi:hypothetical protein
MPSESIVSLITGRRGSEARTTSFPRSQVWMSRKGIINKGRGGVEIRLARLMVDNARQNRSWGPSRRMTSTSSGGREDKRGNPEMWASFFRTLGSTNCSCGARLRGGALDQGFR